MRLFRIPLFAGALMLVMAFLCARSTPWAARVQAATPADRIGIVVTGDPMALTQAGVHWYETYGFSGTPPAGLTRAAIVRLTPPPDQNALRAAVKANPGSAWVIGNEPNVPTEATSDNLSPANYAIQLNTLANLIHQADASALIVGPNVLNWSDTCVGCGGYTRGQDWTQQFYDSYLSRYGTRPPIDRWAIHTYELNWQDTPTLHTDFHIRQMTAFRAWLDNLPAEEGRLIWNTELGFHWAFPGWTFDAQNKLTPVGSYDNAGVQRWLATMLSWLIGDGANLGLERSFLYAQAPGAEAFSVTYGGLSLFSGLSAGASLTPAGQQLASFLQSTLSGGSTAAYAAGWNLVGGPAGTTFAQAMGPLYTFTAGATDYTATPASSSINAGQGYWAYFATPTTVALTGGATPPFTLTAPAGQYVMVANPSSTQTVTVSGADIVYAFDPSANTYVATTILQPGQGGWVFSSTGGTIILQSSRPGTLEVSRDPETMSRIRRTGS